MRSPAQNAELALLLEVAGTPKPGNVDRHRDLPDLHFEHFLAGAVGAAPGLRLAEEGASPGHAFERAVAGMSEQRGGNTQFGCLLLLVPLVGTAATGDLTPERAADVVEATTVDDAVDFYRAFDHVAVAVEDPPEGLSDLDVRRGSDAVPAVRERGLTLYDLLAESAPEDGNAREWVEGFPRTFDAAATIREGEGPVTSRAAHAFVELLASEPDTLVRTHHGPEVAAEVMDRAAEVRGDPAAMEDLAEAFVAEGINPGTTADAVAAALFVALETGVTV